MTHFLGRLVERARGTAPRVEPVVASRFAPAAFADVSNEQEPAVAGHFETNNGAGETSPARSSPSRANAESPANPSLVRRENAASEPPAADVRKTITIAPETLLVPGAPETRAPSFVRQEEASDESDIVEPLPTPEATPASPRKTSGEPTALLGRSSQSQPPSLDDSVAQAPIVRVTIGRIEVRAVAPTPAPARKPNPPRKPTLTLDAYLEKRNEALR